MRLVETDTEGPTSLDEEIPTPPRPERRRVSVSLILTLLVLVSTVVIIYVVFPEHHNALMTAAIDAHHSEQTFDVADPTPEQFVAWRVALLGKDVPWPDLEPDIEVVGVLAIEVLKRSAALVQYRFSGQLVSLLVQRSHRRGSDQYRQFVLVECQLVAIFVAGLQCQRSQAKCQ